MRVTLQMYRKEMLEMLRSYKLLWIPVVFILLGVMQPLSSYYLPDLLKASGEIPAELLDSFPIPGPAEVMVKVLSQYSLIGVLLLVIAGMNTVSGELSGRTAALVLVRPVASIQFIAAKWAGQISLVIVSFVISYASSWYYTELLLGTVPFAEAMTAGGLYLVWLSFAVSLTLFCSTLLRGGAAAVVSLLVLGVLYVAYSLVPSWMAWNPARLLAGAAGVLSSNGRMNAAFPLAVSFSAMVLFVALSAGFLRRRGIPD